MRVADRAHTRRFASEPSATPLTDALAIRGAYGTIELPSIEGVKVSRFSRIPGSSPGQARRSLPSHVLLQPNREHLTVIPRWRA